MDNFLLMRSDANTGCCREDTISLVRRLAVHYEGFAENDWIGHTVAIGGTVRLAIIGLVPEVE